MGGRGVSRGRSRGKRGNISIWGSATATEYRGAHYRRQANYPSSSDFPSLPSTCHPPFPSTAIPAKRSRYLLLEETFCSKYFVILRTVESCDYSEPIDAKSWPRLRFATPCAIQCAMRKSSFLILMRIYMYIKFIQCLYIFIRTSIRIEKWAKLKIIRAKNFWNLFRIEKTENNTAIKY